MTNIAYTKVNVNDEEVTTLSKLTGEKPETICSMINNQRYRKVYNQQRNQSMKELRDKVKELEQQLNKEVKS